jgi:hypothetical protein
MKKHTILFTILILTFLYSCTSTKINLTNDLIKNHNVQDKVFQITETRFSNAKFPKKEVQTTLLYKFNDFGNTTFYSESDEYNQEVSEYFYDKNNFLNREIDKDNSGKIYKEIQYEKENSNKVNFKIFNDKILIYTGFQNIDENGNILSEKTFNPNGSLCMETINQYDEKGNKTSIKFHRIEDNFINENMFEYSNNLVSAKYVNDISKFDKSKTKVIIKYIFDSKNNWVSKKEYYYDEKIPLFETNRIIEYK